VELELAPCRSRRNWPSSASAQTASGDPVFHSRLVR